MGNEILGGLKTKSRLKVRDRISEFLPIQGSSSERKSAGHPNSFLVPLKNSHLWSFKILYEIRGGPGNLYIIIHGRSQKLSIPHPTPYKQSAERFNWESSRQLRVQCGAQSRQFSSRQQLKRDQHIFRRSEIDISLGEKNRRVRWKDRRFERSDRNAERCETT